MLPRRVASVLAAVVLLASVASAEPASLNATATMVVSEQGNDSSSSSSSSSGLPQVGIIIAIAVAVVIVVAGAAHLWVCPRAQAKKMQEQQGDDDLAHIVRLVKELDTARAQQPPSPSSVAATAAATDASPPLLAPTSPVEAAGVVGRGRGRFDVGVSGDSFCSPTLLTPTPLFAVHPSSRTPTPSDVDLPPALQARARRVSPALSERQTRPPPLASLSLFVPQTSTADSLGGLTPCEGESFTSLSQLSATRSGRGGGAGRIIPAAPALLLVEEAPGTAAGPGSSCMRPRTPRTPSQRPRTRRAPRSPHTPGSAKSSSGRAVSVSASASASASVSPAGATAAPVTAVSLQI